MTDNNTLIAGAELKVEALQGVASGFMLDPLEQAIESTVRMMRDELQHMKDTRAKQFSPLSERLGAHLDALLTLQIQRVSGDQARAGQVAFHKVE
ncbi:Uncharacterized protein ALO68_03197 [Pseudomonas syringae pv. helianthi]|uniref:Uncharacterized protein n=1 Tax=Pseudomonas syringae pv. helianthi TaxID=251654 RepID=A0A0P9R5U3_9PSED|nr:hypothetical protein [Pseudomonas syringae group genomosp. 7]KPX42697.1 Uncharacterized protein ALO68_03197 [Pseudomonas syringae pv. helianthi]UNB64196.1 hypothetical protein MME54_05230 [Pseudomonas syringae pv. helianthi]